jgi:hypothetical protein
VEDAAANFSWCGPVAGHQGEEPNVRLVEVGEGAYEEEFVVDLGVVGGDAVGEGASEARRSSRRAVSWGMPSAQARRSWRRGRW